MNGTTANEEITIDYGKEWEQAWRNHVANWQPPPGAKSYVPAYQLQQQINRKVKTVDEGGMGSHIHTYCHEEYRRMNGLKPDKEDYHRCRAVKRYRTSNDDEFRYVVETFSTKADKNFSYFIIHDVLFDVPRDIFHFEDAGHSRDHQMPWSFRHEMMVPDDMWPKAWMNKIPMAAKK